MTRNKWLIIVLVCLTLVMITTIFRPRFMNGNRVTPEDAGKRDVVRLAVAKALITTPVLLALRLNYFAAEGLDVVVTGEFSSSKDSIESMLAGEADISMPATTPFVFNSFTRQDYSIFCTYTTTYEAVKIIARADRGINSASGLKHKKIGVVPGTISQILLDTFLAYNKIMLNEVETVGLMSHELLEAIKSGRVDAISIWEPFANNALNQLADNGIQIPSSQVYRTAVNMAVMNDFAQKHPQVLQKVVRALIKANDFIKNNNEEARVLMAEVFKLDKTLISKIWEDLTFTVSLDQLLLVTMESEAKWAIEHKYPGTDHIPNYLNYVNYKALEIVDPDSVTIIREEK